MNDEERATRSEEGYAMPAICPNCDKDDRVQKVSSVVSSGQATGTFSGPSGGVVYAGGKIGVTGGYTTLHGETMSGLARNLAPPQMPPKPRRGAEYFPLSLALLGSLLCLIGLAGGFSGPPEDIWQFPALMSSAIVVGLILYRWARGLDDAKLEKWENQKPQWESALEVWNNLYYCERDYIVFNPANGMRMPADQLQDYWLECGKSIVSDK